MHRPADDKGDSADALIGSAASPPPRLSWLDPARGVAILFVLLYHTFGYLNKASSFHGECGVDAFLLLSGFGLAYGTRAEPWVGFAWRRLKRLLPAYWIVLTLCLVDSFAHGASVGWRQVVLHYACLHLIWGDTYGFAICMSFWFIGLIVPLYVWFALLRPWLLRGKGYAALGISLALATLLGQLLLKGFPNWGPSALGHAPHRLPQFFLGAIAGLAYVRRDPPERFTREPILLLGLAVFAGTIVYFDWAFAAFVELAGIGIIVVGMSVTAVGERWRRALPPVSGLTVIGGLAYEVYLLHQYVLLSVLPRDLMPRLAAWFPAMSRDHREWLVAVVAGVGSLWVAWALRWVVSFRESVRTRRPMLRTLAAFTVAGIIVTAFLAWPQRPPRPRTFELSIGLPLDPVPACAEPLILFGTRPDDADAVSLDHDGHGLARFRIDHSDASPIFSDWLPAASLTAGKINVIISADFLEVRSAVADLRSPFPPHAAGGYGAVGTNPLKLPGIEPAARSRVVRSAEVVRTKEPALK